MWWLLQRQIGGPGIDIIIDRRERDRRTAARSGAASERRRGDRRVNRFDERLRQFGWVVVDTPAVPGEAERCVVCGAAIAADEGRYRPPHGAAHIACYEGARASTGT
jgi:hypothetical protein